MPWRAGHQSLHADDMIEDPSDIHHDPLPAFRLLASDVLLHGIAPFPSEAAPAASRTSAAATPAPYSGSAFAQLWMWFCWISCDAPPTWRAVFSKSAWRWAGFIFRNRSPGCW